MAFADNSTMWAGWLNVTISPATVSTKTYSSPGALQPGANAFVCAYLNIVDGGRSVLVSVEVDGTCPNRMSTIQLLHLTSNNFRSCFNAQDSPVAIQ